MNLAEDSIFQLQKLQNAAAKLILGRVKRDSASQALQDLHWLNIKSRIVFKIVLTVYKMLNGLCPPIIELNFKEGRSGELLLLETPTFKTKYGKRLFAYNGPRLWNAIPLGIKISDNAEVFKKQLKTFLFSDYDNFIKNAYVYCE